MDYSENKSLIQSLAKGLTVLEYFTSNMDEYGIIELSEMADIPESTVQRIVNTLEFKGYIHQNPQTKKYCLSLKLLTTNAAFQRLNRWLQKNRKHMVTLNEQCGETVNLAIRDEDKLVYIDKVDSKHLLRPNFVIGAPYPLYCTALGKSLISDFQEDKLKYLFMNKLEPMTPYTKITFEDLNEELILIREKGYIVESQQFQLGLYCVGVPIYGFGRKVVAALSVSIPLARVGDEPQRVIDWALVAAENISREFQLVFE